MPKQKQYKVDYVISAMLTYIIDNKFQIGSKLPSEDEFTKLFDVSRLCVREALRGLKFLGVVQTGTRRGTIIKDMDFSLLSRALGFQIAISDFSFFELLNARMTIELGAIDLLINKAKSQQLDELQSLADCLDEGGDVKIMQAKDCAFHKKLIMLADNTILLSFSRLLELFFSRSCPSVDAIQQTIVNEDHLLLVKALREKNKELARGLLQSHLSKYQTTKKRTERNKK